MTWVWVLAAAAALLAVPPVAREGGRERARVREYWARQVGPLRTARLRLRYAGAQLWAWTVEAACLALLLSYVYLAADRAGIIPGPPPAARAEEAR